MLQNGFRRGLVPAALIALVGIAGCEDDLVDPRENSEFGEVTVDVTTTGYEPDFTDYTVGLEGGQQIAIEPNGEVLLAGAPAGDVSIVLEEVPEHCTVSGSNPQQVSVAAEGEATVSFAVTCEAVTGGATVSVAQTGVDVDNEVSVTADPGGDTEQTVTFDPAVGTTILNIAPGARDFELSDVAPNCTITEVDGTASAEVVAGQNVPVAFNVTCVENIGDLTVTIATTGTNQDDGYTLTVGDLEPVNTSANGNNEFTDIAAGPTTVTLGDVAENCTLASGQPTRSVNVAFNDVTTTTFTVNCQ